MDNIKCTKAYENSYSLLQYAQIDFTGKCNNNCIGCSGRLNHTGTEIPLDKAKEVLDAVLAGMNIREIFVACQAEFTLYSHCIDIIDYIEDNFKNVTVRQDTNGIFIPEGFIERLNSLKNIRYDLSVSLWGISEEGYLKFHRTNNLETVLNNIRRYLKEISNPNVVFRFSVPYWDENQFQSTISAIRSLCAEVGKEVQVTNTARIADVMPHNSTANSVAVYARCSFFDEVVPMDYCDDTLGRIYTETVKTVKDGVTTETEQKRQVICKDWNGIRKPMSTDNNCSYLNNILLIRVDGGIAGCLGTTNYKEHDLGNIFDQPVTTDWFKKIYTSEKRKRQCELNATTGAFEACHRCISRICY